MCLYGCCTDFVFETHSMCLYIRSSNLKITKRLTQAKQRKELNFEGQNISFVHTLYSRDGL